MSEQRNESSAATPSWPERVIVDGREVPIVIDPMLPDHVGVAEWNLDFQGNPTTPKRIVLRAREERVLLHEVLHCLLGDNEALVRRATLLYDLGWRLPMGARACECDAPRCERDGCQDKPTSLSTTHPPTSAAYTEGWQGDVYRWLAKRIDRLARRLRYPSTRRGVRMWLEDVADALVWKAIRRGWK